MFDISPLIIFLLIGIIGFLYLIVSLVFFDLFDFAGLDAHAEGILDSRVISVFMTAFGGFGALGIWAGLGTGVSTLLAATGGALLGFIVSLFARFLYRQQASSSVTNRQLIGRAAQVVVAIPPGGVGQVTCRIGEERVEKLARIYGDKSLPPGTMVHIEEIAGDSVIVSEAPALPGSIY